MVEKSTRQLAAVMFTDVVGYTAMMQRNEEEALSARVRQRDATASSAGEHGGRVVQHYGDGSLTVFPSAVAAVSAAIDIQRALASDSAVPIRIGIHQGEVSFDDQGVYGDAVNVAARIQTLAVPGSVLVSEKIFDELKNRPSIPIVSLGHFCLKNVVSPVAIHAIAADGLEVPTRDDLEKRDPSAVKDFVAELKRRRVFRVVLIYVAAMFAVLQALDIMLPALGLPYFVMRLLVITTLVGLPIAFTGSWLFDITSGGIVRTAGSHGESPAPIRLLSGGSALLFAGVLAAGGLGWFLTDVTSVALEPMASGGAIRSIAVLPFENVGDNPEDDYFSDGLSDELRIRLSSVPELDVAARASSLAAMTGGADHTAVALALGVRSVLAGSVAKSDARVRVQTRLLSADGGEIWSAEYERLVDDLFVVQDEVSRSILGALEMRFAEGELSMIDEVPVTNQMAYDKYLWGQFNVNRGTEAGVLAAIDQYQMSIALDSVYAPAWAGAAEAHARASELLPDPRVRDALEAGASTALEALRIDPESSEARSAMGLFLSRSYDWTGAGVEFQRALANTPTSSPTLLRRAHGFAGAGQHEQAVATIRAAERVDMLSSAVKLSAARVLAASGRLEQAIGKAQEGIRLSPDDERIWTEIGFLFLAERRFGDAGDALARVAELRGIDPEPMAAFVARAERLATTGQAQDVPAELSAALRERSVDLARYQLAVGQYDSAIATLQRAIDLRAFGVGTLVWLPDVDPIRADPRFQAMLVEMHIGAQQPSN